MNKQQNFAPDWASPPGRTIADLLMKRGLNPSELSEHLKVPPSAVSGLIDGTYPITQELAGQLQAHLGATAKFWITREQQYRADFERMQNAPSLETFAEILPLRDMVRFGWLDRFRRDDGETAAAMRFFGLSSVKDFDEKYEDLTLGLAFRKSASFEIRLGSLAAWFRAAEIQTEEIQCQAWRRESFDDALLEVRQLTRDRSPDSFLPKLTALCAEAGVAVAVVRAPTGCPVSGATFFQTPNRAIILLSFRHLTDDHFWFSFFHEAGHLILHGEDDVFIESESLVDSTKEQEANNFAARMLVPDKYEDLMKTINPTKYEIVRFARMIGTSPGIITGQLQHLGIIRRNQMNFLKRRFKWAVNHETK